MTDVRRDRRIRKVFSADNDGIESRFSLLFFLFWLLAMSSTRPKQRTVRLHSFDAACKTIIEWISLLYECTK